MASAGAAGHIDRQGFIEAARLDGQQHGISIATGGIGHERLHAWMHRNELRQEQAAEAIGVSRRMLNYYLSGAKPIPKTVWLACLGWEASRPHARNLPRRLPTAREYAALHR